MRAKNYALNSRAHTIVIRTLPLEIVRYNVQTIDHACEGNPSMPPPGYANCTCSKVAPPCSSYLSDSIRPAQSAIRVSHFSSICQHPKELGGLAPPVHHPMNAIDPDLTDYSSQDHRLNQTIFPSLVYSRRTADSNWLRVMAQDWSARASIAQ